VLLAVAGCGSSSGGKSTQASTAAPAQTTASTASSQPSPTPSTPAPATSPAAPGVVTASAGAVSATLHAGTHHPRVNRAWPIRFTVTDAGRPARASVSYEYLFGGQVVARRSHYTFTGRFADIFRWPSSAAGYPLTFRAVIVAGGQTIDLDYPVQVAA
jgi:hypothetical protein